MLLPPLPLLLLSVRPLLAAGFGFGPAPCCMAANDVAGKSRRQSAMRMSSGGDDKNGDGSARNSNFQRVLLAATATPFVTHGEELPLPTRRLISDRARVIFAFCSEYLAERNATAGWDIDLYASGGYVRDLLLGRISSDLDLSLGLARCPPDVTVAAVARGMDGFARARPDLAVQSVEVASRLSDGAEEKAVDAAQVCLVIGGEAVYVDLLPTIGAETYDPDDRIPRRNPRGSAEEDSLRRDLTIGAMLLEVNRRGRTTGGDAKPSAVLEQVRQRVRSIAKGGKAKTRSAQFVRDEETSANNGGDGCSGVAAAATSTAAAIPAAANLRFVLLDYHGGIEDICTRTLRCPVPRNASLSAVWDEVVRNSDEEDLARSLGLDRVVTAATTYPSYSEETMVRALWWAKMMRDDPYRLLRALRFSATLGFRIDSSFWLAAPFALRPGIFDAKVSHTRKVDELRKVAQGGGGGAFKVLNLFRTVLHPPVGSAAFRDAFFAASLADVGGMDSNKALRLVAQLPPYLSVDATVGAVLAVALLSSGNKNNSDDIDAGGTGSKDVAEEMSSRANGSTTMGTRLGAFFGLDVERASCEIETDGNKTIMNVAKTLPTHVDASVGIAASLGRTLQQVEAACDGLRAPASVRQAAVEPLSIARRLLEPLPVLGMHFLFARAVAWPLPAAPVSIEDRARQFATMVRLWDVLRLDPRSTRQRPFLDPLWVLALLAAANGSGGGDGGAPSSREAFQIARGLEADLQLLLPRKGERRAIGPQPQGGALLGSSVAGLPEVPPHLRGQVMGAVHVLSRLRGDAPTIETPDQLRNYLQSDCDGLLAKLADEWWAPGGEELRSPYVKE